MAIFNLVAKHINCIVGIAVRTRAPPLKASHRTFVGSSPIGPVNLQIFFSCYKTIFNKKNINNAYLNYANDMQHTFNNHYTIIFIQ